MSAPKPTPNAAETANSPASSCVTTKPAIADACSAEPQSNVSNAPMRSEIAPQNWRHKKPTPSTSDSMAAPRVAEMPRSLQSATRCACGIDIVTQHKKEANARSTNTTFGGQPKTFGAAF